MFVFLDLSAAFDTIDHDNLFCILEKYVIYKMLMLTYKSYYNIEPSYLCELSNKK